MNLTEAMDGSDPWTVPGLSTPLVFYALVSCLAEEGDKVVQLTGMQAPVLLRPVDLDTTRWEFLGPALTAKAHSRESLGTFFIDIPMGGTQSC